MSSDLKGQFFSAMLCMKKAGMAFSAECEIQMNELAILQTITGGCGCADFGINLNVPEIQKRLQISKPAVSYILNTLEKKQYIVREIDPKDRRKISVTATPQGMAAAEQSTRLHNKTWEKILTQFGEEDMRLLIGLLSRLAGVCDRLWQEED